MEKALKILVVDDEIRICRNVEKILRKNDYEVTHAQSAREALEKLSRDSFSLLISDIVMPEMDGLELLKLTKEQWPLTKVMMMTAYASTDTAMKAIQLGAEDYVPKPFTPNGLRSKVENVLISESVVDLQKAEENKGLGGKTDIGMPGVERSLSPDMASYCPIGEMTCDIFKKLGNTCKGGTKTGECPQKKAKEKKAAKGQLAFDAKILIGIDQPFRYEEVVSVTGPEYVKNLQREGVSFVPYEELKKNVARMMSGHAGDESGDQVVIQISARKDVLVIDDEVAVNNNIRKILVKKGYHVEQAITKDEALQKIEERAYPLILLDLRIPGVKGLELLETIRDRRPDTKVIIVTGYANIETAVETAKLGAIDFLSKPFTPNEIRTAAENALQLAA
ncbi:MAG: response regulator [Deltaproteobacteria bacterium]|nr:response regulator [Deltaproteobacteria bacterium]